MIYIVDLLYYCNWKHYNKRKKQQHIGKSIIDKLIVKDSFSPLHSLPPLHHYHCHCHYHYHYHCCYFHLWNVIELLVLVQIETEKYLAVNTMLLHHPIPSHPIPSHPISSHPIPSHPIVSNSILSHPILSYPILSYPILFHSIPFYTIQYHIISYHVINLACNCRHYTIATTTIVLFFFIVVVDCCLQINSEFIPSYPTARKTLGRSELWQFDSIDQKERREDWFDSID